MASALKEALLGSISNIDNVLTGLASRHRPLATTWVSSSTSSKNGEPMGWKDNLLLIFIILSLFTNCFTDSIDMAHYKHTVKLIQIVNISGSICY